MGLARLNKKTITMAMIVIMLLLFSSILLISCQNLDVEEIEDFCINELQVKSEYFLGEEFDVNSVGAYLKLIDGRTSAINPNKLKIIGFNKDTVGEQIVTIQYFHKGNRENITFNKTIRVVVKKHIAEFSFEENYSLDKIYDGKTVDLPIKNVDYYLSTNQEVEISWYLDDIKLPFPPKDAGEYTLLIKAISTDEETEKIITKDFTIKQREVKINWSGENNSFTYIYDPTKTVLPVASVETGVDGERIILSVEGEQSDVGSYEAVAFMKYYDSNYILKNTTKAFEIKKKQISIAFLGDNFSHEYSSLPAILPGITKDGDGEIEITWFEGTQVLQEAPIDAGEYTVKIEVLQTDNYDGATVTKQYVINKKVLEVSWGTEAFDFNNEIQKPSASVITGIEGEEVNIIVTADGINAGEHTAVASLDESVKNYELAKSTMTKEYVINKINYDLSGIKFNNLTTTYNGKEQGIKIEGQLPVGIDGYTLGVSYEGYKKDVVDNAKVSAIFTPSQNYNAPDQMTAYLTILPKEITISWTNTSQDFNNKELRPTASLSEQIEGEEILFEYSNSYKNAGSYNISVTPISDNYTFVNNSTTFTINKIQLDTTGLSLSDASTTYNGENQIIEVQGELLGGIDEGTLSVRYEGGGKDVQTDAYLVSAIFSYSTDNYIVPNNMTAYLTILPKELDVSWSNLSFDYNGNQQKPTAQVDTGIEGETIELIVSGEQTNAGTYTANASISADITNFVLNENSVTKEFTINKINYDMENISYEDVIVTYDGKLHNIIIDEALLETGKDGIKLQASYSQSQKDVLIGGYEMTVTFTTLSQNYNTPNSLTARLTILPKELDVTWGNSSFNYNGNQQKPTAQVDTGIEGETIELIVSGKQTNAGTYTANASISADITNFVLNENSITKEFTINKINYDMSGVTFSNKSVQYNGQFQSIEISGSLPIGLDGFRVNVTYEGSAKNVSSNNKIIATFVGSQNYNTPNNMEAYLTITPKILDVEWSNLEFEYDGATHKPVAMVNTEIEGETLELVVTGDQKDAGEHGAVVALKDQVQNYTLNEATKTTTFKINPKVLSVEWSNLEFEYDGVSHKPTATVSTGIEGETIELVVTGEQIEVGNHTATANMVVADTNYTLTNASTQYSIIEAQGGV